MSDMDYDKIQLSLKWHMTWSPEHEILRVSNNAIDQLRARVAELEAERADIRAERDKAYTLSAEQEARIAELEAENEGLRQDAERLDWLADRNNTIGNVQLPTECVAANLSSLRAAIDMAMNLSIAGES